MAKTAGEAAVLQRRMPLKERISTLPRRLRLALRKYWFIYLLALLLDEDAKEMLEGVIYPDEEAAKIFLDYFNEYIADGYVVDRLLQESGADEDTGEIREDIADSLDDEYCCLRSVMDSREGSHGEE